jgi:hypothetical protein
MTLGLLGATRSFSVFTVVGALAEISVSSAGGADDSGDERVGEAEDAAGTTGAALVTGAGAGATRGMAAVGAVEFGAR